MQIVEQLKILVLCLNPVIANRTWLYSKIMEIGVQSINNTLINWVYKINHQIDPNLVPQFLRDNRSIGLLSSPDLIRTKRRLEVRSHQRSLLFQPRRYIRNYDIFLRNLNCLRCYVVQIFYQAIQPLCARRTSISMVIACNDLINGNLNRSKPEFIEKFEGFSWKTNPFCNIICHFFRFACPARVGN